MGILSCAWMDGRVLLDLIPAMTPFNPPPPPALAATPHKRAGPVGLRPAGRPA